MGEAGNFEDLENVKGTAWCYLRAGEPCLLLKLPEVYQGRKHCFGVLSLNFTIPEDSNTARGAHMGWLDHTSSSGSSGVLNGEP